MHYYLISVFAALACALCNSGAAVLQKISADREKNVKSLDPSLLWRLFQDKPYIFGVALDILGWLFTLFAVQYLPLFLVEAVIAANIVITAFFERIFRHHIIKPRSYAIIAIILIGLVMIALASSPEKAQPISKTLRLLIILIPIPLGLAGFALARSKSYGSTIGLAALGGLSFGATSVMGRIFNFYHPIWHTIYDPLVFSLIASGILGILLFSIALQRAHATVVNATMTASQTLIPSAIGITFLGDEARGGLWYLVVIGTILTLGGVISLAIGKKT